MARAGEVDWERVRRAYLAGEYSACRRMLEGATDPRAEIWLARIDTRLGRERDAIARLAPLATADERLAAERDVWLAAAYANTHEVRLAHQLLDRALHVLRAPDETYYRAHHVRALACFFEREYDVAWTAASVLLESPYPIDRAQGYALQSWVYSRRDENVRAHLENQTKSLDVYEQIEEPDQYTFVRTLYALAVMCREIATNGISDRLRRNVRRVRVTEATADVFFKLLRVLGWIDALEGDEVSAVRSWRRAEELAPSEFFRVFCLVDRAYLAHVMGRKPAAHELLDEADEKASKLSWSATQDEERLILLTIAQLLAPDKPARAQRYLAMFRSLTTGPIPQMGYAGDRRTRALQLYPQGTALLELGERHDAIRMLEEAWEIFTAFEYGWRAAQSALKLFEATNDRMWLERARTQIAAWPKSWIAREIAAAG